MTIRPGTSTQRKPNRGAMAQLWWKNPNQTKAEKRSTGFANFEKNDESNQAETI
jgi:hypothetical protein